MCASDHGGKPLVSESELQKWLILGAIGITILSLIMLGNWQLKRLDWKLALIERVDSRAFATPVAAPSVSAWSGITREKDEYRHVVIYGRFLHERETLVWAVTEYGNGYWVLTPLLAPAGETDAQQARDREFTVDIPGSAMYRFGGCSRSRVPPKPASAST